jgi:hypothetical protein
MRVHRILSTSVGWGSTQAQAVTTTLMSLDASELEQLLASPDELAIVVDNLLAVCEDT